MITEEALAQCEEVIRSIADNSHNEMLVLNSTLWLGERAKHLVEEVRRLQAENPEGLKDGDPPKYGLRMGLYEEDGVRYATLYEQRFLERGTATSLIGTLNRDEGIVEFRGGKVAVETLKYVIRAAHGETGKTESQTCSL